jgi:uncharacterized protein (TIGR02996 family)
VIVDDQQYLAAITAEPANLDRQLAYADWLAEQDQTRAEVLRTWVEIVRTTVDVESVTRLVELKARYRALILQIAEAGQIPWLQAVQAARGAWINPDVAEKFVRTVLVRVYDARLAATWPLKVKHAVLDSRWVVEPVDPLPPEARTGIRSLNYFVAQGTGDVSDVASMPKPKTTPVPPAQD